MLKPEHKIETMRTPIKNRTPRTDEKPVIAGTALGLHMSSLKQLLLLKRPLGGLRRVARGLEPLVVRALRQQRLPRLRAGQEVLGQ